MLPDVRSLPLWRQGAGEFVVSRAICYSSDETAILRSSLQNSGVRFCSQNRNFGRRAEVGKMLQTSSGISTVVLCVAYQS